MDGFEHQVEWDPAKAEENRKKHGVSFETAATVLLDPLALTIPDAEHNNIEPRWVTIGHSSTSSPLVVVHTWEDSAPNLARVRIISARHPTRRESLQYKEERL